MPADSHKEPKGNVKKPGGEPGRKPRRKPGGKPGGTPRRRRGVKLRPTELLPTELGFATGPATVPPELAALSAAIDDDGGRVLAAYREPLGGHTLLFAALPVERVVPTPFQRDLSDTHVRRLTHAMDKTRRFLDPIIVVREPRSPPPKTRRPPARVTGRRTVTTG